MLYAYFSCNTMWPVRKFVRIVRYPLILREVVSKRRRESYARFRSGDCHRSCPLAVTTDGPRMCAVDTPTPGQIAEGSAIQAETASQLPHASLLSHLFDVHAHPTDNDLGTAPDELRMTLCAMSTNGRDLQLVEDLARRKPQNIVPCFGACESAYAQMRLI